MIRFVTIAFALLSPFLFPFPLTVVLGFGAALFFPPTALFAGVLTDFLYLTPGASFAPYGTLTGVAVSVLALFLRRFAKERLLRT
ncbi:MAG: hypothetical protein WBK28_02070 [Minisyncoccia bacterium]